MKCLIIDAVDPCIAEELGKVMEVTTVEKYPLTKAELKEIIAPYDALIMRVDPQIDAELIEAAENLKFIGVCSVGLNHIDMDAAKAKGLLVQNAPGLNGNAVAELTICKMLELARSTVAANNDVKFRHTWDKYKYMGSELKGKTVGILGFGRIGQRVGFLCRAFGMKVLAYDPYLPMEIFEKEQAQGTQTDPLFVLHNADFVTIHVPLTNETRNLVCKEQIEQMRPGAFVLNMSRGGIVNEKDAYEALKSGKLGGYASDVLEVELSEDSDINSPLFELDNFIITPHLGAQTNDAAYAIGQFIIGKCKAALGL
ncbi:MAG: phosphoglycerate dehydrogenase [Lachnospiraceae bacterium]|nr:phosphoglycerate dehydrogenase [Lachnospiraceae bacterium]